VDKFSTHLVLDRQPHLTKLPIYDFISPLSYQYCWSRLSLPTDAVLRACGSRIDLWLWSYRGRL